MTTVQQLAALYRDAHNAMRNSDGLQPQEAFDELLKYLFFKQINEERDADRVGLKRTLNFDGGFRLGDSDAAKEVRRLFASYLEHCTGTARELWRDHKFKLSDAALLAIHEKFIGTTIGAMPVDMRSAALRMFIGPDLRRGLGIYLTPDDVVRTIVAIAAPLAGATVYDPACGSGTFLIEAVRWWRERGVASADVYGSDINARMLLLAELNLAHEQGVTFHGQVLDAVAGRSAEEWPLPNSIDHVLTNPPFGVYVDPALVESARFTTASGRTLQGQKIQSELLFIEQSLRWLKPGGMLSIVVPRSVVTNERLGSARDAIDEMGALRAVVNLPSETFAGTGTQAMTSVLFIQKHSAGWSHPERRSVIVADVTNVGFDSTGREREGSQLASLANDVRSAMQTGASCGIARVVELAGKSLAAVAGATGGRVSVRSSRRLSDIIELAQTGRTPGRSAYTETGVFTVKVGNLTGQGIDWTPRDRNFVNPARVSEGLVLRDGDIVLTSSAHTPKYIAQKVDIVSQIPEFVGGIATFVGEVLRLRVVQGVDPYELLAFLRAPSTRDAIQQMVRGQTAHLRPKDLLDLPLPDRFASPELVSVLKREAEIAAELNQVAERQRRLLAELFEVPASVKA